MGFPDHRRIGRQLKIYATDDACGPGLPRWLPAGAAVRAEIERSIVELERRHGYSHVYTPQMAKRELYERSGHWCSPLPSWPTGQPGRSPLVAPSRQPRLDHVLPPVGEGPGPLDPLQAPLSQGRRGCRRHGIGELAGVAPGPGRTQVPPGRPPPSPCGHVPASRLLLPAGPVAAAGWPAVGEVTGPHHRLALATCARTLAEVWPSQTR